MRRNKLAVFLHLVWATWDRVPLITPQVERELHRCIHTEVEQQGCTVLALNGIEDHVHLLVTMPSTVSIAELVKQVKGVSSRLANLELFRHGEFKWQGSYGAFSISHWDVDKIAAYIKDQKKHHAEQSIVESWEETFEEVELARPKSDTLPGD
jgi:REP element-mobilizing transposase RayT